jgi:DNA polymerase (family X)
LISQYVHAVIRGQGPRGTLLELNVHPERLDLRDTYCRMARDEGVLVSINSDAHSALEFDNMKYDIGQARRGWLTKDDVLNMGDTVADRQLVDEGIRDAISELR